MQMRSLIMVLGAACLVLLTGGPSSFAEGDTMLTRDPTLQRGRGFFFFGSPAPQRPVVAPRPVRVAPATPRRSAPVVVRDDPVIPKVDVAHHILVIGDSLGHLLAGGLDDALNDRPDVAVIHKAKLDSGLVRADFHDWPKVVGELLESDQKVSIGVVLLGLNDRQAIREGDIVHEPLSPRWTELYRARIDAVLAAFAARRLPLIWVGMPPVQNARLSADFMTLNESFRQQVEKAGGHYVDLWGAFVDAENRYAATGPDVSGQTMRLRLGDGIHFTPAGARKAAHFVDLVIRRIIEAAPAQPGIIALPAPAESGAPANAELQPGGVERLIDLMVGDPLAAPRLHASLMAKPLAGPILPLTGQPPAGEQALLASIGEARGRGEATAQLDRIFGDGIAPEPRPGRLDDHRWPR
jgi:hypothetical protein